LDARVIIFIILIVKDYYITEDFSTHSIDSWIRLDSEKISDLIKLLGNHQLNLEKNKDNLSEQDIKILNNNSKQILKYIQNFKKALKNP
jgi:hypothetical protein